MPLPAARAKNICSDEALWVRNAAVDVGFGGKMHDRIDLCFRHHLGGKVRIGNIAANETIVRPLFQIGQVAQIARIGLTTISAG
ncbi:hypothetical protein QJ48_08690 [Paenibacillus sp. A3]|nr:hypothetical protein QJ48_08690 [Paenibacillus sp. A3]